MRPPEPTHGVRNVRGKGEGDAEDGNALRYEANYARKHGGPPSERGATMDARQ
jgi:hypothetical protein